MDVGCWAKSIPPHFVRSKERKQRRSLSNALPCPMFLGGHQNSSIRLLMLTSALAAVSNLHFFDDHHHFITHSSCHYSPLTHFIIRSRTYAWRVWYGGGWVGGGGDNDVRYNYWTHCVRRWSSPFHHAFILPLLTSHALHHSFPHIRMEGMVCGGGWVGGWGGIMTFVTTTGHIVSVDDHHHFITHSSCHYSPLTHFIIRSRTYAWRVWYGGGGGWVGGWVEYIYSWQWRRNCGMDLWQSVPDLFHA